MNIGNLPPLNTQDPIYALGIEGSANKVGVGKLPKVHITILCHFYVGVLYFHDGNYEILSNPRKTFITPPGQGFLPRETAWHHQNHIIPLVRTVISIKQLIK